MQNHKRTIVPAWILLGLCLISANLVYGETDIGRKLVISTNGLNVRESPGLTAKKITTLPFGTPVDVKEVMPEEITVGKDKGYWLKIAYYGNSANPLVGYVFDKFVGTKLPVSSTDLSILNDLRGYYIQSRDGDLTCRLPGLYIMANGLYYVDRCNNSEQHFCVARGVNVVRGEAFVVCDETKNVSDLQNKSAVRFSPDAKAVSFMKISKGKGTKFVTVDGYKYERKADAPDEFWM